MTDTTSIVQFFKDNDLELQAMIRSTCYDSRYREDIRQEFYLKCIDKNLLINYDSSRAAFSTYIYGCLMRISATYAKRENSENHLPLFESIQASTDPCYRFEVIDRVHRFEQFVRNRVVSTVYLPQVNAIIAGKVNGEIWDDSTGLTDYARNLYYFCRHDFLKTECLWDMSSS